MTNEQGQQILVAPQVFADAIQQLEAALAAVEQERDFYQGQEMTAHKRADMLDAELKTANERAEAAEGMADKLAEAGAAHENVLHVDQTLYETQVAELTMLRPRAALADSQTNDLHRVKEIARALSKFLAGELSGATNLGAITDLGYLRTIVDEAIARYDALSAAPVQANVMAALEQALSRFVQIQQAEESKGREHLRDIAAWGATEIRLALEPAAGSQPPMCHADRDGDCNWTECPQKQDYQQYCPLAKTWESWAESQP